MMSLALPDNNIHPAPPCARLEKAKNLLVFWAFSQWAYQNRVEINPGYTSNSILNDCNSSKEYKPFCFKLKTNAKSTRPEGQSKIPIGGLISSDTNKTRAMQIDALFATEFSERSLSLLIALFMPKGVYGGGVLSDAKIAQVFGFKVSRACQIKYQAVEIVIRKLLSPMEESA